MAEMRKIGNYQLSRHQAAALLLVKFGSFPLKRLFLNILNRNSVTGLNPGLEKRQWQRILDRLCELKLVEREEHSATTRVRGHDLGGPTYTLTAVGLDFCDAYKRELNDHAVDRST